MSGGIGGLGFGLKILMTFLIFINKVIDLVCTSRCIKKEGMYVGY